MIGSQNQQVAGSLTGPSACPRGFRAGGVACGIKVKGGLDLAIIAGDECLSAAAMFTRNQFRAAPLQISAEHLRLSRGRVRSLLINSGCANAATGEEGVRRAHRIAHELSIRVGCSVNEILINSTGVIGVQLPDQNVVDSLTGLLKQASPSGLTDAARAILTTDTHPKIAQVHREHQGRTFCVTGIAKGAGMIHPNMATMIAVLMTDAAIAPPALDAALRRAVDKTFHRISIDGDTSTNDSVFALASGKAGDFPHDLIESALTEVSRDLAMMIVRDGEGAAKLIHVRVTGAVATEDALCIAQTIAGSLLVRTAVAGGDPNWGRIIAAIGRSGIAIDPNRLTIAANNVPLFSRGAPTAGSQSRKEDAFRAATVVLTIDLGLGNARDEFFTCDLTEQYVRINAHYMT